MLLESIKSEEKEGSTKVATIHFKPSTGDVKGNLEKLVVLIQDAIKADAKIIILPEMITTGYAFYSRESILPLSESSLNKYVENTLLPIAKKSQVVIVIGLPYYDIELNSIFNSALVIKNNGDIERYHKRSQMIESSYNAMEMNELPIFETDFGTFGINICADFFYPLFQRKLALRGVDFLVVPINTAVDLVAAQARAIENDISIIFSNRYGKEDLPKFPEVFDQNSFTIPSSFSPDFNYNCFSAIIRKDSTILYQNGKMEDSFGVADLPIGYKRTLPVERRPKLYNILNQDTLNPQVYPRYFGLPDPIKIVAASYNPGDVEKDQFLSDLEQKISGIANLKIIVVASISKQIDDGSLKALSVSKGVDIVVYNESGEVPTSYLFTSEGTKFEYKQTHNANNKDPHLFVINRSYGRLAILHDIDAMATETYAVMMKMGVDVIALQAFSFGGDIYSALWKTRSLTNNIHSIVSSRTTSGGSQAIYPGDYLTKEVVDLNFTFTEIDVNNVREKATKYPRYVNVKDLII